MFPTSYLTTVFLVFGCVIFVGFICGRESWWEYFGLFLVFKCKTVLKDSKELINTSPGALAEILAKSGKKCYKADFFSRIVT